ncbi:hypothetical protein GCM10007385_05350 [Tateyamaria omphalii]|nr:hypothetical protein GCM10007385_05350 [Tateyamaria omphalii]
MARDGRIDYAKRDPKPAQASRELTTYERVELLVSGVLRDVSIRLEEKRTVDTTPRER